MNLGYNYCSMKVYGEQWKVRKNPDQSPDFTTCFCYANPVFSPGSEFLNHGYARCFITTGPFPNFMKAYLSIGQDFRC